MDQETEKLCYVFGIQCFLPVFMICRCLIKDFEARPSVTHLLEHPFIKQAHGKDVALQKQLAVLIQEQQELGCKTRTKWVTTVCATWLHISHNNVSGCCICVQALETLLQHIRTDWVVISFLSSRGQGLISFGLETMMVMRLSNGHYSKWLKTS